MDKSGGSALYLFQVVDISDQMRILYCGNVFYPWYRIHFHCSGGRLHCRRAITQITPDRTKCLVGLANRSVDVLLLPEVFVYGDSQVFTTVDYLHGVAMNLVVGVDYLPSDPDQCTFLRMEFHLSCFFPSLQCRQILLKEDRVLAVFDVSIKKTIVGRVWHLNVCTFRKVIDKGQEKQWPKDRPLWYAGEYVNF